MLSSMLCMCSVFFFFFKQKTAYETRISDWSSDVCSSDLFIPPILPSLSRLKKPGTYHEHVRMSRPAELLSPTVGVLGSQSSRSVQIGRASCRERVCQYV